MNTEWLLIETLGPDLRVVAEGIKPRAWRRLSNVFRGEELRVAETLIRTCATRRAPVLMPLENGHDAAEGVPLIGPSGDVYATHVRIGSATDDAPPAPTCGTFESDPRPINAGQPLPPRLWQSDTMMNLIGMDHRYRDRSVYGPVDLFTRIAEMPAISRVLSSMREPSLDGGDAQFTVRRDDGLLQRVHYVYRMVDTAQGPRIRGCLMDMDGDVDRQEMEVDCLDATLAQLAFAHLGIYGAIVDVHLRNAPYVVKWLTEFPPGMGHGVSEGQSLAIHPDDLTTVITFCNEVVNSGRALSGKVRIRQAGNGGWMHVSVSARVLQPMVDPEVALMTMSVDCTDPVSPTVFDGVKLTMPN